MKIHINIRTGNGLNSRQHWAQRARAVKAERQMTALAWATRTAKGAEPAFPLVVKLTRLSPSGKPMDSDNLPGALKGVRDQVAQELGVDDGTDLIAWEYAQERGAWGVIVEISPR